MNKRLFRWFVLFSIFLFSNDSFSQGPGIFNVTNNTSCSVTATVHAYNGSCGALDCGAGSQGNISASVPAHSAVNIASGYSGGGDVWGQVYVTAGNTTDNGDASCFTSNGLISGCGNPAVQWDSCNGASIP